ncbi:CUB domain-containing protein 1-like [Anabas testudineus]|uniref:CUB domain-containing protein 1-like n=1 Tax=Anabas testudineus TaxID=64144 RepID=UPI000E462FC8|nr:CUB domain-containing protein 1-like [Anabas testudineus]
MSISTARVSLQTLLFLVFTVSGAQKLTITLNKASTIHISNTQVRGCRVCTGPVGSRQCGQSLLLKDTTSVSLLFDCSRPQDVFKVEIVQNIDCTTTWCNGHIIQTDSSYLPLLDFKRTFTWNLKASALTSVKIDFTKTGLRQIHPSEICPDSHTYTLQVPHTTGSVTIGKFCRGGLISNAQILNHGSFSLEVPAGQKLQNGQFDVSVGDTSNFAKITLTFPKGISSSELLSPNYPDSFPDDDEMEWHFQVSDKHKISVQFLKLTEPQCQRKKAEVVYQGMLIINLTVVTSFLAIVVIGLLVACVVIRKKKNRNHQTPANHANYSTYVLPGHSDLSTTNADEYHVYTKIDDTLVYSHLLEKVAC